MTRLLYAVFSEYWGGAEEYVARIVERLPDGFDAVVGAAHADVRTRMARRVPGARVIVLPAPVLGAPAAWTAFRRVLGDVRPAVVHVNLPSTYDRGAGPAAVLSRLAGSRVVTTEHLASVPRSRRRTAARRAWGHAVARAITVCEANREALVARGVARGKIVVVLNGAPIPRAPIDPVRREATRASIGVGREDVVVLSVGALDARKRPDALVRAAAAAAPSAPRLRVVCAGGGDGRGALEALIAATGAPVHLLGARDDVPDLLEACDALVLLSDREGLPFAVLEALAASRPVVATAVDGVPEAVVHDGCGLLVPPRDENAVVRALVRVATDRDARARWGRAASLRARERFDADRMARETVDVYRAVAGIA